MVSRIAVLIREALSFGDELGFTELGFWGGRVIGFGGRVVEDLMIVDSSFLIRTRRRGP